MTDNINQYTIDGPCMLIHKKGEFFRYSPIVQWNEVSFAYVLPVVDDFEKFFGENQGKIIIKIKNILWIKALIQQIQSLLPLRENYGVVDQIDALSLLILMHVFFDDHQAKSQPLNEKIAQARSWFELNYSKQFNIDEIAREFDFSPCQFRKTWQLFYNCSPKDFINNIRLTEAKRLLKESNLPINQIAQIVGYLDQRYFSTWFNKYYKMSPRKFRQSFLTYDDKS
ncbi:MAG: AraC family transcriptional regulator [Lentisphaeria bacterium]